MFTLLASVAVAAVPDVSWFPAVLTPGKLISAVPSNDTPPIFLAVCSAVAVPALPVISPVNCVAVNDPLILKSPEITVLPVEDAIVNYQSCHF